MSLSAMRFNQLQARLADDQEFQRLAALADTTLSLSDHNHTLTIRVHQGKVDEVADGEGRSNYEIVAPESEWRRITAGKASFSEAINPLFGSAVVRGDRAHAAADTRILTRLFRALAQEGRSTDTGQHANSSVVTGDSYAWPENVAGKYATVDGIRTYYEVLDSGVPGPEFLVLHTSGRDGRNLQAFASQLATTGKSITVDYPGHGKSWPVADSPNGCYVTGDELADFLWKFSSLTCETGEPVVVGCSIGANLALMLAARHSAVRAVVAIQGADYTPSQSPDSLQLLQHPRVNPAALNPDRTRSLIGSRAKPDTRDFLVWESENYTSPVIYSDMTAYGSFDVRSEVAKIRCPVLLVRGRDDWIVSEEMVQDTAARIPSHLVEVVQPDGLGHFAPTEAPDEVAALAREFLGRHGVG